MTLPLAHKVFRGQDETVIRCCPDSTFCRIVVWTLPWRIIAFLILTSTLAWTAPAPRPDYFTQVWTAEDGLPQNAVTAIVQTRDGYLWLGTYGGLVRFDGVRFVAFKSSNTPELQSSRVTSLFEDSRGVLWIGHETGGLSALQDGHFRRVDVPGQWPGGKVLNLGTDRSGDLWLFNDDGLLVRARDGRLLAPETGTAERVVSVARSALGEMWVLRNGRVSALQNGALATMDFDGSPTESFVQGIGAARQGGLWVARGGRLRRWHEDQWKEDRGEVPWGKEAVSPLLELRDGTLAGGTVNSGLHLVPTLGHPLRFDRANALPQNWVRSLCEDHERNLWIGAGSGGLVALRAAKVSSLTPPDQWQGRAVLSVSIAHDGAMWISTEGAGLYRYLDGQWSQYGANAGFVNPFVWAVSEDAQRRVWAGTWGGGVFVQNDGIFARPAGLEELTAPVTALLHTSTGVTWIGTGEGLVRYEVGRYTRYGREAGLRLPDVRTVLQTGDGAVWFGMAGGGLGCLKDGALRQFSRADGLTTDHVQCLWLAADGALWLGTAGDGLIRLKNGHFVSITSSQGLPNDIICHIADDKRGYLWLGSHAGILRVKQTELNQCADTGGKLTDCLTYGRGEGLPSLECSGGLQPAGCRTADGRLWFPTTQGLVGVNPDDVKVNRLPPPVVFEELRVDGQLVKPTGRTDSPPQVPPGRQRFEFHYTGLSFTVPEKVRFRVRLEGAEKDWTDAGTERVAVYRYIQPGDYTFRVIACNNDGIWNEEGAAYSFRVLPHFWQTWWFRLLTGLASATAVAGSVWFIARRRMYRKLERLERQQAVERERARIAKDIHDDLGASLTRITMLSQSVRGELGEPAAAAEDLDRIYTTARELTRAMDEIVWAVNPQHDTLDSLATYLGRFAQEYLAAAHVRCRLDVPMHLPAWPLTAETRHNLFLAFKEALHNVVKHAAATEVRVSLAIEHQAFTLRIEDLGRGFSTQTAEREMPPDSNRLAAGNGLANMQQRLAEIGGRCEVQSTPGSGTKVAFIVPVRAPAE